MRFCAQQFFPGLTLFGFRNNTWTLRFFHASSMFSRTDFYAVLGSHCLRRNLVSFSFLLSDEKRNLRDLKILKILFDNSDI